LQKRRLYALGCEWQFADALAGGMRHGIGNSCRGRTLPALAGSEIGWEFGFDSGSRRDSVLRKSPITAGQIVIWIERGKETGLAGWCSSADIP
jgi:hypothetical protein